MVKKGHIPWNKGLTKDVDLRIKGWSKELYKVLRVIMYLLLIWLLIYLFKI